MMSFSKTPKTTWFRVRYTVMLSVIAVTFAMIMVPSANAFFRPELTSYVMMLGFLVTIVVAPPICYFAGVQFEDALNSRDRLAQQSAELEAARDTAEEAARAKSRFLAIMSHEIRTPLNGVLGTAKLLADRDLAPQEKILADALLDSGTTLMTLLNDLLDLSKSEAGRMEIAPVEANLRAEVSRLKVLFAPLAEDKGITLEVEVAEEVPAVLVFDPVRLRQCVSNLVGNAIKFTSEGGVHVRASMSGPEMLEMQVIDSGIGIPKESQQKVFEAFAQADANAERAFNGTGLGLAICRSLSQKMGGSIQVSSVPGQGATFTLTCRVEPVVASDSREDGLTDLQTHDSWIRGQRFLVADDVPTNRMILKMFLEQLGASVILAPDGSTALKRLAREGADMVLLDSNMPGLSGLETARRIRADHGHDLPMLLVTANADTLDPREILDAGFSGVVEKPILDHELIAGLSAARAAHEIAPAA